MCPYSFSGFLNTTTWLIYIRCLYMYVYMYVRYINYKLFHALCRKQHKKN